MCSYYATINIQYLKKFHNKVFSGAKIQCVEEKNPLGSSGALYNARKKLKKNFLFCNGDTFFDINLSDLINEFFRGRKIAQLALKKKIVRKNMILLDWEKHLLIDDLRKKKKLINSGVCIFSKKIIPYLVKNGSLEKNVYKKLIRSRNIYGKEYKNDFRYGKYFKFKKLPKFLERFSSNLVYF